MRFKGFKPIKLTGEPSPTVGDGHQDRRASDGNAALKTQRSKAVGLFATFTRLSTAAAYPSCLGRACAIVASTRLS
jgi:hypothetical protein